MEAADKLIKALDDYIETLGAELDDVVPIAINHGWESDRYEIGISHREEIDKLREQYLKQKQR